MLDFMYRKPEYAPSVGLFLRGMDTVLTLVSIVLLKLCVPMNLVEHHVFMLDSIG